MIETISRPPLTVIRMAHGRANAMDTPFLLALTDALHAAERSEARAVVLTGRGSIFSAGVDLVTLRDADHEYLATFLPVLSECFRVLYTFPKPVVAAVNGHALAGGCILTCASDYRLMARGRGRIGVTEHQVGVPFPWLALEIVRQALPPHHAQEAILFGDSYLPETALARGFVDELVDDGDLLPRAEAMALRLAAIPTTSYAISKKALRQPVLDAWAGPGVEYSRRVSEAWNSEEVRSAVRAFVEKTLKR
jgi:enoyl-CoA hydratase